MGIRIPIDLVNHTEAEWRRFSDEARKAAQTAADIDAKSEAERQKRFNKQMADADAFANKMQQQLEKREADEKRAADKRAQLREKELQAAEKAAEKQAQANAKAAEKQAKADEKAAENKAKAAEKAAEKQTKADENAAKQRERDADKAAKAAERQAEKEARAAERKLKDTEKQRKADEKLAEQEKKRVEEQARAEERFARERTARAKDLDRQREETDKAAERVRKKQVEDQHEEQRVTQSRKDALARLPQGLVNKSGPEYEAFLKHAQKAGIAPDKLDAAHKQTIEDLLSHNEGLDADKVAGLADKFKPKGKRSIRSVVEYSNAMNITPRGYEMYARRMSMAAEEIIAGGPKMIAVFAGVGASVAAVTATVVTLRKSYVQLLSQGDETATRLYASFNRLSAITSMAGKQIANSGVVKAGLGGVNSAVQGASELMDFGPLNFASSMLGDASGMAGHAIKWSGKLTPFSIASDYVGDSLINSGGREGANKRYNEKVAERQKIRDAEIEKASRDLMIPLEGMSDIQRMQDRVGHIKTADEASKSLDASQEAFKSNERTMSNMRLQGTATPEAELRYETQRATILKEIEASKRRLTEIEMKNANAARDIAEIDRRHLDDGVAELRTREKLAEALAKEKAEYLELAEAGKLSTDEAERRLSVIEKIAAKEQSMREREKEATRQFDKSRKEQGVDFDFQKQGQGLSQEHTEALARIQQKQQESLSGMEGMFGGSIGEQKRRVDEETKVKQGSVNEELTEYEKHLKKVQEMDEKEHKKRMEMAEDEQEKQQETLRFEKQKQQQEIEHAAKIFETRMKNEQIVFEAGQAKRQVDRQEAERKQGVLGNAMQSPFEQFKKGIPDAAILKDMALNRARQEVEGGGGNFDKIPAIKQRALIRKHTAAVTRMARGGDKAMKAAGAKKFREDQNLMKRWLSKKRTQLRQGKISGKEFRGQRKWMTETMNRDRSKFKSGGYTKDASTEFENQKDQARNNVLKGAMDSARSQSGVSKESAKAIDKLAEGFNQVTQDSVATRDALNQVNQRLDQIMQNFMQQAGQAPGRGQMQNTFP